MRILQSSITVKIVVPTILLFMASIAAVMFYMSNAMEESLVKSSVQNAEQTISQFKLLRKYYTENVVGVVKGNGGMKISFDHQGKAKTIPLPATMIHDLSSLLGESQSGLKLKLYSEFPFPNRSGRSLDDFGRAAIDYFRSNPDGIYVKNDFAQTNKVVRVAIADKMVAQACVNCHNTRSDTPKNDWELGDVRGVLEVITSVDDQFATNEATIKNMFWLGLVLFVLTILGGIAIAHNVKRLLTRLVNNLSNLGHELSGVSGELSGSSQALAEGASEQAAGLEETSSTMEQIASQCHENVGSATAATRSVTDVTAFVRKTAENAQDAVLLSNDARQSAQNGSQAMENISQAMHAIRDGSEQIAGIVEVINEITHQTKMLATNAAIEAARAGEQGKGFAVVADEVSKLAEHSKGAAKEIVSLIKDSVRKAETGTELAEKGEKLLSEILEKSSQVVDLVGGIAEGTHDQSEKIDDVQQRIHAIQTATDEQAKGVEQVSHGVIDMDRVTQANAAKAEETATSAQSLEHHAQILQEMIHEISSHVGLKRR